MKKLTASLKKKQIDKLDQNNNSEKITIVRTNLIKYVYTTDNAHVIYLRLYLGPKAQKYIPIF